MTTTTQTVRDIALENPSSIRVFERLEIDYCCGGRIPLTEACAAKNLEIENVIASLEEAAKSNRPVSDDWTQRPLASLTDHIVATHHAYCKSELPRLAEFAKKVVARHGETRQELPAIQSILAELSEEFTQHMAKEEVVLFPHIVKLERHISEGTAKPRGRFGTVANPIAMMTQEHDDAGRQMAEIRKLSQDYTPPADACPTYRGFYESLSEFETDLHRHVHLENNILFPRAIDLDAGCTQQS
jgi:regulator of cell morphogenesis and NO signaling